MGRLWDFYWEGRKLARKWGRGKPRRDIRREGLDLEEWTKFCRKKKQRGERWWGGQK